MELTKVASIHLFLLGFSDELTNFSLTMNNPSTQAESLEIDNIEKRLQPLEMPFQTLVVVFQLCPKHVL